MKSICPYSRTTVLSQTPRKRFCPHGAGSAGGGRRERCEGATTALWVVVVTSIDSVVLRRAEARLLELTRKPPWALAREQYFTAALAALSISNHSKCAFSKHRFFKSRMCGPRVCLTRPPPIAHGPRRVGRDLGIVSPWDKAPFGIARAIGSGGLVW